jgi:hypothetical protein
MTAISINRNFELRPNFGEMFMTEFSLDTVHCLDKKYDRCSVAWLILSSSKMVCNCCGGHFFFFGARAPIWAFAYLHETPRFTSVF